MASDIVVGEIFGFDVESGVLTASLPSEDGVRRAHDFVEVTKLITALMELADHDFNLGEVDNREALALILTEQLDAATFRDQEEF
jgi:hypothetical protein